MIAEIIARLKAEAAVLASVEGAEEIDALTAGAAPRHAAAFVIPFAEEAQPSPTITGRHRQTVEMQFLVAFLVRRHGPAAGGQRVADFDAIKASIEAALAGWTGATMATPCNLVAGRGQPLKNGVTLYVQTWTTTRFLTAN